MQPDPYGGIRGWGTRRVPAIRRNLTISSMVASGFARILLDAWSAAR